MTRSLFPNCGIPNASASASISEISNDRESKRINAMAMFHVSYKKYEKM